MGSDDMKRIISVIICCVMVAGLCPVYASASYNIKTSLLFREDFENYTAVTPNFSVVGEAGAKMLRLSGESSILSLGTPMFTSLSGEIAVEADIYQTRCTGSGGGQISMGLFATSSSGAYKNYRFGYHDIIRYNEQEHNATSGTAIRDRLSISRTEGSANYSSWYVAGVSEAETGALNQQRGFNDFYKLSAAIANGNLAASLTDRYSNELSRVSVLKGEADFNSSGNSVATLNSGGILIGAHSTGAYVDNIRAYRVNKATDVTPSSDELYVVAGRHTPLSFYANLLNGEAIEVDMSGIDFHYNSNGFSVVGDGIVGRTPGNYNLSAKFTDVVTGEAIYIDIPVSVTYEIPFSVESGAVDVGSSISFEKDSGVTLSSADSKTEIDNDAKSITGISEGLGTIIVSRNGFEFEYKIGVNPSGKSSLIQTEFPSEIYIGQKTAVNEVENTELISSNESITIYDDGFTASCDGTQQIIAKLTDDGSDVYKTFEVNAKLDVRRKGLEKVSEDFSANILGVPQEQIIYDNSNAVWRLTDTKSTILGNTALRDYRISGKFKVNSIVNEQAFYSAVEIAPRKAVPTQGRIGGEAGVPFVIKLSEQGYIRAGDNSGPDIEVTDNQWHTFSIEVEGECAVFYVDDKSIQTITTVNNSGGFTVRAENCDVYFDDFIIERLIPPPTSAVPLGIVTSNPVEPVIYDTVNLRKITPVYAGYGDGSLVSIWNDAVFYGDEVYGDYMLSCKEYSHQPIMAEYKNMTCPIDFLPKTTALPEEAYINYGIIKRRENALYNHLTSYNNGIPLTAGVNSLAVIMSESLLYPKTSNHETAVRFIFEQAIEQEETQVRSVSAADFHLLTLITMLRRGGSRLNISDEIIGDIKEFALNFDYSNPNESMSENHKLVFYSNAILAAELWEDEIFYNGQNAVYNHSLYKGYLEEWVNWRYKYGMGEHDSGYYLVDMVALDALYSLSEDISVKHTAYDMLNYLYLDMAAETVDAAVGGARSRMYVNRESFLQFSALDIMFDTGAFDGVQLGMQSIPIMTGRYVPAEELTAVARDNTRRYQHIERKRLYEMPDDAEALYSLLKYTHVTPNYSLGSIIRQDDIKNDIYIHSNKFYKSTSSNPSGVRIAPGFAEIPWSLSIGKSENAIVFDSHPGADYTNSSSAHAFFSGSDLFTDSRYYQYKNIILGTHKITNPNLPQYTHFWINKNAFDEIAERDNWIFLRKNKVFVALLPLKDGVLNQKAYEWGDEDKTVAGIPLSRLEVKINSPNTAFICEVADDGEFEGTFEEFITSIKNRQKGYTSKFALSYKTPDDKALRLNANLLEGTVDHDELYGDNMPLFTSPVMNAEWGGGVVTLQGGLTMPSQSAIFLEKTNDGTKVIASSREDASLIIARYRGNRLVSVSQQGLISENGNFRGEYFVESQAFEDETTKVFVWKENSQNPLVNAKNIRY